MDSFSSPSMSSSGSPPNPEALMEQIKAQLAQAYAQELLEDIIKVLFGDVPVVQGLTASNFEHKQLILTVGNKCFAKCVTKPGSSMSGSESSCVSRCVDRYIEATGIVGRALFSHR